MHIEPADRSADLLLAPPMPRVLLLPRRSTYFSSSARAFGKVYRCCLRGLLCCLRHGQPPTPPQQGARDDWRRTPDRPDTHHAGKQTFLNVVLNGKKSRCDDNETDYHREVYWHRCCSTSTPTTTYTPTLAVSSTQTTCASRHKETT